MASLLKQGAYYYAQFYSKHKRPRRKKVPLRTTTRRVAERLLRRLEDEYALGTYDPWAVDEADGGDETLSTIEAAVTAYLATCTNLRPRTVDTYKQITEPFRDFLGADFPVARIQPRHVLAWLDSTKANDVTRHKYNKHLGYLWRFLVRRGEMEKDLSKLVKLRKIPEMAPKDMTEAQEKQLVEYIRSYKGRVDYSWLVDVIRADVCLGLRLHEVINLRWEHVSLERRTLTVSNGRGFTTKSGRERALPIAGAALEVLSRRFEARRGPGLDYVFVSQGGKLRGSALGHAFLKLRRGAELPEGISFHSLRHTFGTRLAERGVPITVIKELMGHSTITTTERYTRHRPDVAQEWVRRAFA